MNTTQVYLAIWKSDRNKRLTIWIIIKSVICTCRGPGLDISCAVDHYVLGFPFLGCTQTIPGVKEKRSLKVNAQKLLLNINYITIARILNMKHLQNPFTKRTVHLPVSIPKKVKSVHRQWFHWACATPAHTNRQPHEQLMQCDTYCNTFNNLVDYVKRHLILQMNDRRAPMVILADVCWLSFFTVPVFKSNILPANRVNSGNSKCTTELHVYFCLCVHVFYLCCYSLQWRAAPGAFLCHLGGADHKGRSQAIQIATGSGQVSGSRRHKQCDQSHMTLRTESHRLPPGWGA